MTVYHVFFGRGGRGFEKEARGGYGERDQAVGLDLVQHVVEEANAGGYLCCARRIEATMLECIACDEAWSSGAIASAI